MTVAQKKELRRLKRLSQMLDSAAKNGHHFSRFSGKRSRDYEFNAVVFTEIAMFLDELRALKEAPHE